MAANLMSAEQLNKAWIDLQEEYREAMRIYDIHAAENAVRQKVEIEKAKARVSAEATYPQWFGGPLTIPVMPLPTSVDTSYSYHWLGKDAKPQEQTAQAPRDVKITADPKIVGAPGVWKHIDRIVIAGDPDGPQVDKMSEVGNPNSWSEPVKPVAALEHPSLGRALSRMNRGFMPRYGEHYG